MAGPGTVPAPRPPKSQRHVTTSAGRYAHHDAFWRGRPPLPALAPDARLTVRRLPSPHFAHPESRQRCFFRKGAGDPFGSAPSPPDLRRRGQLDPARPSPSTPPRPTKSGRAFLGRDRPAGEATRRAKAAEIRARPDNAAAENRRRLAIGREMPTRAAAEKGPARAPPRPRPGRPARSTILRRGKRRRPSAPAGTVIAAILTQQLQLVKIPTTPHQNINDRRLESFVGQLRVPYFAMDRVACRSIGTDRFREDFPHSRRASAVDTGRRGGRAKFDLVSTLMLYPTLIKIKSTAYNWVNTVY